jgi:hypothetical protein
MIAPAILYPMTTISSIESCESSFSSLQMLPLTPSFLLAPLFVVMMHSIHQTASQKKKALTQLGFSFSIISVAILSIHYYIQLTFVQQGLLNGETAGIWQFAAPNPHSFFWTLAT